MGKITFRRSFELSLAVLVLAVGAVSAWEWWRAQRLPSREPDFRGRVVSMETKFMVETPDGGRCWFTLPRGERILRGGEPAQLTVGQTVSVWSSGPVMMTYPPGGHAFWIVIEDDPKEQPQ